MPLPDFQIWMGKTHFVPRPHSVVTVNDCY